jgi:hypothetical protein
MINQKQKELDRAGSKGTIPLSSVYLCGIEHEKIGLERALHQIRAIRGNAWTISDENVTKMYG